MIEITEKERRQYVIDPSSNKVMRFQDFLSRRGSTPKTHKETKYDSEMDAKAALKKKISTFLASLEDEEYVEDFATAEIRVGNGDLGDDDY